MVAKLSMIVTALRVLFELAKDVADFVKVIEEHDPDDGKKNGEKKKELVLNVVESIYSKVNNIFELPIETEEIVDLTDTLIEIFVKFYNTIGWFRNR